MRFFVCVLLIAATTSAETPIYRNDDRFHPVVAEKGMVAAQEALAARAAMEVLREGGNAVDAAVTLGFTLAVTLPRAGNLAGGGFMVIHFQGQDYALDFREQAPADANRDMFLDDAGDHDKNKSMFSYQSVGVPGTVAGLEAALKRFGSISMARAIEPAIKYAKDGFIVSANMAAALKSAEKHFQIYPASRSIFMRNGKTLERGQLLLQEDLSRSLQKISKSGSRVFYEGSIATSIASTMQKNGGLISLEDLAAYKPVWRKPLVGEFMDYQLVTMPPPSSGGIHLLQIMHAFNDGSVKVNNSSAYYHHFTEAARRSYADRSKFLGDPDFNRIPIQELLSVDYLDKRYQQINPDKITASVDIHPGEVNGRKESPQTTHFSVVDKDGNMVSCTTTLNFSYGMRAVVPGTGILLNNQMDDFSSKPGSPNAYGLVGSELNSIEPRKRMLSSMTPVIVKQNNKAYLATGSPGGSRIITTVAQVLLATLAEDKNIAAAIAQPRVHHQWLPDIFFYEKGLSEDTLSQLKQKGHLLKETRSMGSVQTVQFKDGLFYGATDPRKPGGLAIGVD